MLNIDIEAPIFYQRQLLLEVIRFLVEPQPGLVQRSFPETAAKSDRRSKSAYSVPATDMPVRS